MTLDSASPMPSLVPPSHRAYLASHPLAVGLSVGIALTGYVNVLFPEWTESSAQLILPPFILLLFNVTWTVGGTLSALGLLRAKPKVEGAGMSLLAAGLLANYLAFVYVRPEAAVTGSFILTLAVACAFRAVHLTRHSYVNLDVPHDQPGLRRGTGS